MGKKKKSDAQVFAEGQSGLEQFKGASVRKVMHHDEWHFSVVDVVAALTDSSIPRRYWTDLKVKLVDNEGYDELYDNIVQLKMPADDGKDRLTDAANVETIFRIIQSIPSKKANVFKRWLAKVGYERILEFQNPAIAIKRAIFDYKLKGYDEEWIERRVQGILARQELTGEWARRGVKEGFEYATLTNLIQEGTFGLAVQSHREVKSLSHHHNLRDHMTSTELAFTMLGETSTKDIAIATKAQGFNANQAAAKNGGKVAGDARRALELQTGQSVVSRSNFLPAKDNQQQLD